MFEVHVGEKHTPYRIHKELLMAASPSLRGIISNGKEATENCIEWDDVDTATAGRFFEFLYTGTYSVDTGEEEPPNEKLDAISLSEGSPPVSLASLLDFWASIAPTTAKKKKSLAYVNETKGETAEDAIRLEWRTGLRDSGCTDAEVLLSPEVRTTLSELFLSHARLYVLADKYLVDDLQALVCRRLYPILHSLQLCESTIPSLCELIHYVFQNLPASSPGKLRQLLVIYTACVAEYLEENYTFKAMVTEIEMSGFSSAVLLKVSKRLKRTRN